MEPAQLITSILVIGVIVNVTLAATAYLILLERKIASWTQDRIGPNRVGLTFGFLPQKWHMLGLGQPVADGLKLFVKEDYTPRAVDRALFFAAPVLAVIPAMIGWAIIPWGGQWDFAGFSVTFWHWLPFVGGNDWTVESAIVNVAAAPINIGIIYILAVGSLAVYGVVVGAWASNNKYSFLGGLRATAQMLSYEIPLGLTVLCVLLMAGSARADVLVNGQAGYWFGWIPQWLIFQQPLAAVIFLTCLLAESNRAPFDLAEAEQELVGGYHTEYASMKWALFFLGEYMHMITASAFFAAVFLGGWHLPWIDYAIYGHAQPVTTGLVGVILKMAVFLAKVLLLLGVMMWIRWTLPRFRFDQLMRLAWRGLIPTAMLLLLATGVLAYYGQRHWMWAASIGIALLVALISPLIPAGPPVNRRVPLPGSRFSPATE